MGEVYRDKEWGNVGGGVEPTVGWPCVTARNGQSHHMLENYNGSPNKSANWRASYTDIWKWVRLKYPIINYKLSKYLLI